MFHFGSTEDQVNLYTEGALSVQGPLLPDVHLDEMSVADVKNALAYARIACESALNSGAPTEVIEELTARHDAIFAHLASIDDNFRERVLGIRPGMKPFWLGGYDPENIAKYERLASAN